MNVSKNTSLLFLVLLTGISAVALPLLLATVNVPIGATSIEQFVSLHTDSNFKTRASLTFLYFPAAIAIHYLAMPSKGKNKQFFILGFIIFFGGNIIDLLYRAIQFEVVHFKWAPEYLKASSEAVQTDIQEKIRLFSELSPAINFSFALLFFFGRTIMGASLWLNSTWLEKCASIALIVNGLWNILPHLNNGYGSLLGPYYVFPWLFSLTFITFVALKRMHSNSK